MNMSDLTILSNSELDEASETLRQKIEFYCQELAAGADENDKERGKRIQTLINVLTNGLARIRMEQINRENSSCKKLPLV